MDSAAVPRRQQPLDDRALVRLSGGRVDLEDRHRGPRAANAGGVEARAQQHELADPRGDRGLTCVVDVAHPKRDVGVQASPQVVKYPERGVGRAPVGEHGAQHRITDETPGVRVLHEPPPRWPQRFRSALKRIDFGGPTRRAIKASGAHINHRLPFARTIRC